MMSNESVFTCRYSKELEERRMQKIQKTVMLISEIGVFFLFFFGKFSFNFVWIIVLLFFLSTLFTYLTFKLRLKSEKSEKVRFPSSTSKNVLIFTVIKNDISSAKRFVEHYKEFPSNFHVLIFDDASTDGTYKYLLEASKKFENIATQRLVRSGRVLHPKGEGLEKVLKEANEDFVFLCDGDSLISLKDLNFLVSKIEKEKLDYASAQRRNIEKKKISYYSADTNELFMSLMNAFVTPFGGSIFPGSGHLFKKSSFKKFKYEDVCLSDDTYIGDWINKNKKRGKKFYSANVKELVPEKFSMKISQMLKWTRNGILERMKEFSIVNLVLYILLFAVAFSFLFPYAYISLIVYSVLAILFGNILGMNFAFKRTYAALLGFLAFSFELSLSTAYTLYLYNKAIFSPSFYIKGVNFERTKHE
jgi:cellulose synthase/poly-beta-1,6-N-acetylglucosamine synthase-like glycosyltransferase